MKEHDAMEQAFKNGYEKGRQEVAKQILDALIKTVDDNEFPCDTSERIMWVVNSDFLTKFINDAKKKYIGE